MTVSKFWTSMTVAIMVMLQLNADETRIRRERSRIHSGRWRARSAGTDLMFRQLHAHWRDRCAAVFVLMLATSVASAAPSKSLQGDWLTANGHGVVQIGQCGEGLCGRIVGIDRAADEPMPTDVQGRPQCGLAIISADKAGPRGTWHGEITDPRDGTSYQTRLSVDDRGDLRLRVFIGIPELGATQVWHRFSGRLAANCRIS
jgi:uncharacterized protein (DUF2147 family)